MNNGNRSVTMALAEFISGLKVSDLPTSVVNKAKQHVLDGLGNQIAASATSEQARAVVGQLLEWGGKPEATIVGYGDRVPVAFAAWANAMLGHGVELDDAHRDALTKAGSVLIPSAMSVGEWIGASGEELITALAAGYDTMVRIGLALNPSHRQRGFHTTGTAGTFGAAAITARLLGLDRERTAYALGIAGMQAAGIQAFLDDPSMVKPLSPGKAAFNGVLAGVLASRGFTGPRFVLESKEGFFNATADGVDAEQVVQGLGSDFKLLEMGFKPHAACRYAHGPIDCMQAIVRERSISPDEVDEIEVRCSEFAIRQAGRIETPTLNSAMGSTAFGLAVTITRGTNGLRDYLEGFEDPVNHQLARKVRLIADPEIGLMGRQAEVRVKLKNGEVLQHRVELPKGEPEWPLTDEDLKTKFLGLATMVLSDTEANAIIDRVAHLEQLSNVAEIPPLTKAAGTPSVRMVGAS